MGGEIVGKESEYEIMKQGTKEKARITSVETKSSAEVFKNSKTPEQQLIVIVANINGWIGRVGTIPKPPSKYLSQKSKMAQFITKYKKPPEVGMTVDVATNEKGFWTLVL
jgi:CDP-diacylglycerol pyrophosphatase